MHAMLTAGAAFATRVGGINWEMDHRRDRQLPDDFEIDDDAQDEEVDERVRKGVRHRFCVPKSLRATLENAAYRGRRRKRRYHGAWRVLFANRVSTTAP